MKATIPFAPDLRSDVVSSDLRAASIVMRREGAPVLDVVEQLLRDAAVMERRDDSSIMDVRESAHADAHMQAFKDAARERLEGLAREVLELPGPVAELAHSKLLDVIFWRS